jgi:predicted permease
MTTLVQDLRYAIRVLVKSPAFSAIAILTLALGIGANTALFSVVNGVLLNPLPYSNPSQLVAIYEKTSDFTHSSIAYPNFLDWVREQHSFSALAAFRPEDFNLTGMGEPERIRAEMVSASFFPILGVQPVAGRLFGAKEDVAGAQPVALISTGLWSRKFGSSPDTIGKTVTLNGKGYAIIGIVPGNFRYQSGNFHTSDIYVPIGQWNDPTFRDRRVGMGTDAVGRLAPGVTFSEAKQEMAAIAQHLAEIYPDADTGKSVTLTPLKEDIVGDIRPFLLVLLAAVGFVLLIACVNVANLLLARSTSRTREFAIRVAMGASRGRVIAQLLTESMLLGCVGGGIGLAIAAWGTKAAIKLLPQALPRTSEIHTDTRVLLFTAAISLLAGILFGLAPAIKAARENIHETLKEGGRTISGARHRVQSIFVVVEMALALVLLLGAGLMLRSMAKLWSVNPGFEPLHALAFNVSYPSAMGLTPAAIRSAMRQLHDAVAAVPGISAVSLSAGSSPMSGDSELPFWIEGQPKPATESEMKTALFYGVEPDYLKAMGTPLERGRFLTPEDNENSPFVIVIDDEFVKTYFHGQNPIGKRVNFLLFNKSAEIVGVAQHVKQWGLDESSKSPVLAQFYFPISQVPDQFLPLIAHGTEVVIRTEGAPEQAVAGIRQALSRLNGELVMYDVETLQSTIDDSLSTRRFSIVLLGTFAGIALLLSCIGIYGVISYLVGQRVHEIGIRMALGAQRRDVLQLILGQGTRMALLGVAIGLAASFGLMGLMNKILYGISAYDPITFGGVAILLTLVALAACYIPAYRAMRIDPMQALRYE